MENTAAATAVAIEKFNPIAIINQGTSGGHDPSLNVFDIVLGKRTGFDRVSGELQDHLKSICEKYDRNGSLIVERGAKHPRIEFYTELDDNERDYFSTLFFDPHNEEFYMESFPVGRII